MVGRARELVAIDRALHAAAAGHGGLLLVSGEAGIGKSRLLAECARRARGMGMAVLSGRAVPHTGPFRAVAEALVPVAPPALAADPRLLVYRSALGQLLPGWPVDAVADRRLVDPVVLLGEAVLELLGVVATPVGAVVILDDLHWADPDTTALLGYLGGRLAAARVLLLGAARDEVGGTRVADLRGHGNARILPLPRLTAAEIATLARERRVGLSADAVDAIVRACDGLPLLAEELAEAMEGAADETGVAVTASPTLAELTRQRLDTLPAAAREVLNLAAVLGDLDWQVLAAVGSWDEHELAPALRAAVNAALLVSDPAAAGGLRWRHALTRDAVLTQLLPPEQAALAHRAAAALDRGAVDIDRLPEAAELYAQCGRITDAAALLLRAARAAADAGALGTAEEMLRRALRLSSAVDHALVVELVRVLGTTGRIDEASALGATILGVVDGERRVNLCLHLARTAVAAERWGEAGRFLNPVAGLGDPRVDALRAHVALGQHDVGRATALARAAVEAAERADQPEAVCEALEIVGRGLRRHDPDASDEAFARAEQLAGQRHLSVWRIRALSELGANDMLRTGRLDRLEEARRRATDAGLLGTVAVLELQIGACVALREGQVAMLPWAERAMERADRLRAPAIAAASRCFAARGRLFAGDTLRVEPLLAEASGLAPDAVDVMMRTGDVRGWSAWLDGDPAGAAAAFDRGLDRRGSPTASPTPVWGLWALLHATLDPDPGLAAATLRSANVDVHAGNRGAQHYVDAVTAARAGDRAGAERLIAAGDTMMNGHPAWRHILRITLAETAATGGFGTPDAWLRAAHADLDGTAEVRLLRLCRDVMRRLGLPVPRGRRGGTVVPARLRRLGVTPRELEVLDLVEQGLTNAEVATQLFLSPRTVETHVANLLAKTGIPNRATLQARRIRTDGALSG